MTCAPVSTTLSAVIARRRLAAAALVLAAPVLASCGGNFNQQTNQVYNPAEGVDERSGAVDVLNALIVSGTNGSGTVVTTFVNNNQNTDDRLKSVAGSGPDASLKVTPGGPTTIPAGGLLNLADKGRIFVEGERVKAGYFVELTFTFDRGQAITVEVPVVNAAEPEYADVPQPSTSPAGIESTTPSEAPSESPSEPAEESPSADES